MRKLGKKNVRMVETIEALALVVAASCSCYCVIGSNQRYSGEFARQR